MTTPASGRRAEYDLANLSGIDLFITWWGPTLIAHPIVSFDFGSQGHVPMSIETRDVVGQSYSAVRGFFRQYALIYIVTDERDVVRLRTNFRKDEEVYIFRTTVKPELSRKIFLDYLQRVNDLHQQPEWYNAITNNCTTNIDVSASQAQGRTYRMGLARPPERKNGRASLRTQPAGHGRALATRAEGAGAHQCSRSCRRQQSRLVQTHPGRPRGFYRVSRRRARPTELLRDEYQEVIHAVGLNQIVMLAKQTITCRLHLADHDFLRHPMVLAIPVAIDDSNPRFRAQRRS